MCNSDFWEHIRAIVSGGFTPEGLAELDEYADKFTCGQLLYKRFSPSEQYGCSKGGHAHVIASLLAGAEAGSDPVAEGENDFKRQCQPREQREQRVSSLTLCRVANEEDGCQRGEAQASTIEQWAKATGC